MSAYLVTPATVDAILTQLQLRDGETLAHLFRPFTAPDDPRDRLDELGQLVMLMNVDALRACYPNHRHDLEQREAAAYTFTARPETAGYALKQLDCLMYQCSEGDVSERPLFEALIRMRQILTDRVLDTVPSYAAAPWGVTP